MRKIIIFILFSLAMITLVGLELIPQMMIPDYGVPATVIRKTSPEPEKGFVSSIPEGGCDAGVYGMDCGIIKYLEQNLIQPVKNGQVFCVHEKAGASADDSVIYVSYLCEEFYLSGGKIYEGSGQAGPAKVTKDKDGSRLYWIPRDGSYFYRDVESSIPEEFRQAVLEPVGEKYRLINRQRAQNYFKAEFDFKVEKITEIGCNYDFECETPGEYLLMSRCPFTSACVEGKCAVICPNLSGSSVEIE
jgi:hypothetical protein